MYILLLISNFIFSFKSIDKQIINNGTLIIVASNFKNEQGKAAVRLFRKQDKITGTPYRLVSGSIVKGEAKLVINDLPLGEYAVVIFHDENGNNQIDHNLIGIPVEPMGFSNNWKLTLFSGMPEFDKLHFSFTNSGQEYKINIQ